MRRRGGPARGRRAVAEVVAEILLIALVVSLTALLFVYISPYIPSSLPRQISGAVGLAPATNLSGVYLVRVIYTSGAPYLDELQPIVRGPLGSALPAGTWHVELVRFDAGPSGNYTTPAGWSSDTPSHYAISAGDRFLLFPSDGRGFPSGSTFDLVGTGGFTGRLSVPLP